MNLETAHILIVDDNEMNLDMLSRRLKKSGFTYETASNGSQALSLIGKDNKFDLILLDIIMPEMDGFSVLKIIRENFTMTELPVIMLTAKDESEDIVKCFDFGANDYITKPVNYPVVLSRIKTQVHIKKSEETKANLLNELHKLNSDKDKFFSILSHDLRTPLTPIIGGAEIILDAIDMLSLDEIKIYTETIKNSAEQLSNLLESILQWSGVQIGRINCESEELELQRLVDETIEILSPTAEKKSINLISKVNPEDHIFADKNMISTVIRNLISNSIKFTNNEGEIIISSDTIGDKLVEVSISDTGVGMSQETIDKLFKIDKVHTTYGTNKEKGSGLGLILCKEFIEKNNGKIWVESSLGKGTSFKFILPVATQS